MASRQVVFHTLVQGRNGLGTVFVDGVKTGDKVSIVYETAFPVVHVWAPGTLFELEASVDNQLQQVSAGDWSALVLHVFLFRDK